MTPALLTPPAATAPEPGTREDAGDPGEVRLGYGACSIGGCNCQRFDGYGDTCANSGCGHAYADHW